jgi:hypothetical protein
MKKYFITGLIALVMCSCSITQTIVEAPSNVNMPKNALFISQSGTESNLLQTLIDLENNEMVVLTYNYADLINVTRTGIFLNPNDYKHSVIKGTDAPFEEEVEPPKTTTIEEK